MTTDAVAGSPPLGAKSSSPSRHETGHARRSKRRLNLPVFLVLCLVSVFSAAPMLLVLVGSFRPNADIIRNPIGFPSSIYVENYVAAWQQASMSTYFINSLLVTVCSLALTFILYTPAAYALARWRFRGSGIVQALFLLGMMVSLRIGILPLTSMYDSAGLIDNLFGLILIYTAQAAPLTIIILSTFFRQLPSELEEAALLDGASHPRIFSSVMLPLIRPALATALVLNIGPVWNDFFMPLVMLRSSSKYVIPVGISTFFGEYAADKGLLYAGIVIAVAPVVLLFSLAMKHVVSGLTAGIGK